VRIAALDIKIGIDDIESFQCESCHRPRLNPHGPVNGAVLAACA
jgi:hypothetical protein